MAQNNMNTRWTAPTFTFNTEDQPAAWKDFYTRVIDYLETKDIDPEEEDQHKRGWKKNKNDVYRGGQTSTSNINRQQYHYTSRSVHTNTSTQGHTDNNQGGRTLLAL